MLTRRIPTTLLALTVSSLLALTTGCQGDEPSTTPTPGLSGPATSSSVTPSTSAAASASPAQPSPSAPSASASASPSRKPPTEAQLRKALLSLKDVPPGFEKLPDDDEGGGRLSSKDADCTPLTKLLNAETLPGSQGTAGVAFSGGADGSYVQEDLDAMASATAAETVVDDYRKAVKACDRVRLSLPGIGSSSVDVASISFADVGDKSFAARFTADGGALEGFELIQVASHTGSVVVAIAAIGLFPEDAEAAAQDAVEKVEDRLGKEGTT